MFRKLIPLLGSAAMLLGVVPAALAATVAPHSFTGYHAHGPIRVQGENQCLTATNIGGDRWVLSIFQCDGDPSQLWESLVIHGVTKITLAGHPHIQLSGLPGQRSAVELVDTTQFPQDLLPFNRTVYISGSLKPGGHVVNKLSNIYHNRMAAPQRGRTLVWTGFFFPLSAHRGLIFGGTGWIAETQL